MHAKTNMVKILLFISSLSLKNSVRLIYSVSWFSSNIQTGGSFVEGGRWNVEGGRWNVEGGMWKVERIMCEALRDEE